jgi:hypothetical protein
MNFIGVSKERYENMPYLQRFFAFAESPVTLCHVRTK